MFIYFSESERETEQDWDGAEREGDTESQAGSKLWAVSTEPNTGLKPINREVMIWAQVGRLTD